MHRLVAPPRFGARPELDEPACLAVKIVECALERDETALEPGGRINALAESKR